MTFTLGLFYVLYTVVVTVLRATSYEYLIEQDNLIPLYTLYILYILYIAFIENNISTVSSYLYQKGTIVQVREEGIFKNNRNI